MQQLLLPGLHRLKSISADSCSVCSLHFYFRIQFKLTMGSEENYLRVLGQGLCGTVSHNTFTDI